MAYNSPLASSFINTVKSGGLTNPYGLAAVYSTGKHESGWAPKNVWGEWADPSESGKPGRAGGAMSWRAERLNNLREFAKSRGDDPRRPAIETQAEFFLNEDPSLIQALQSAQSPREAQRAMDRAWRFAGYDRPGGEAARRLQTTQSVLGEILGGEGAQSLVGGGETGTAVDHPGMAGNAAGDHRGAWLPVLAGGAADDTLEDSMATGGSQSLFNLPTVKKPENRSQLLAMVLSNMQKDANRPNPRSGIEAGARALTQGLQGYFAGRTMSQNEADEARQREVLAGMLSGNPDAAAMLQSGVGDIDSWENAILQQSLAGPKEPIRMGDRLLDPDTYEVIKDFSAPPKPPSKVAEAEYYASLPEGDPRREYMGGQDRTFARDRQSEMLMETGLPEDVAKGIAAGRFTVSRDPVSGAAQVVDLATGQPVGGVSEQQAEAAAEAAPAEQQVPQTLWDSTEGVAGIYGAGEELYGGIAGQTGLDVGEGVKETTRNRQMFRTAQNDLIRSLSINPRFPVAEMNRIKEEVQIEPAIMDSEQSLKERMRSVDQSMRQRLENERRAATDPNLPVDTRRAAAQAAKDIENFLGIMGVPQDDGATGQPGTGTTGSGVKWRIVE